MQNTNPLIFLTDKPVSQKYTPRSTGGSNSTSPARNKLSHSKRLILQLEDSFDAIALINDDRAAIGKIVSNGFYLEFNSSPSFELAIKSLDSIRNNGIKLLNSRLNSTIQSATVFIPFEQKSLFFKKIEEYNRDIKPKNEPLISSINEIKQAVVKSFWQSKEDLIPLDLPKWCEVWLRINDNDNDEAIKLIIENLYECCIENQIKIQKNKYLRFPNRLIFSIFANEKQLQDLIYSNDYIAEFRIAKEPNRYFVNMPPSEQAEWASELKERLIYQESNISICILDSGVNNSHILIAPFLKDNDCHTFDPSWGIYDEDGHGTEMAGLSLFGDLYDNLSSNNNIIINHSLESVKIISPKIKNDDKLYGFITMQSISRAEIENKDKKRIIVIPVAIKNDVDLGHPTSWSASIDQLAFGSENFIYGRHKRLIIVSAGNVAEGEISSYPDSSFLNSIESPGESWNAITVGSYTDKIEYSDINYSNFTTVAKAGELSPFSRTSMLWEKEWPVKPEVLFEGGNALFSEDESYYSIHNDLSILTTNYKHTTVQFQTTCMTSASTALAGRFAAQVAYEYPNAWEETIRGLIIHSATWTENMRNMFPGDKKAMYKNLLHTCGYGIPNLRKAISCLNNSFTLILEEQIQPFTDRNNKISTNEMHLYELPWPKSILEELGEMEVTLKVTLSYFIDPNPSESGYKTKYRYASHGLRFDINLPSETKDVFITNINGAIQDDSERPIGQRNDRSSRWSLGTNNRDNGSIHSDYWIGTATELAASNLIAVYPIIGWWRERPKFKKVNMKTRYSLIISLETKDQSIPIYQEVTNIIKNKVKVEIST